MLSGLTRASLLPVGTGFLDVTAGVVRPWSGGMDGYVRAEIGIRPLDNVDLFGFAQAGLVGVAAGAGARVTF